MSLLSWIGRRIGLGLGDRAFWNSFYGGSSWTGRTVGIDAAMKLSAFWACVTLYARVISTLPKTIYEEKDGKRIPRPDHPLGMLIGATPNAWQTPVDFWEGQIAPLFIIGNSYAEKKMIKDRLVALEPIPFDECRPYLKDNGALWYKFTYLGKEFDLPPEKVFHIRGFGTGGKLGLSPLAYMRNALGSGMDVEEASARMFGSGMRGSGFLLSPQTLNDVQRAQAQKNLIKPMSGPEAEGKIGLLEAGWKFQATNIPPKDAEMIASRNFTVEDICRFMGTPPILVGHSAAGQTMWGSGIEQIMIGWLVTHLGPLIMRLEASCNRWLFDAGEIGRFFVDFDEEALLRADSTSRAALMSSLAQNGLRTRNELRQIDRFDPMDGGDELTVQSNLVPISMLGKRPAPAPGQAPPDDAANDAPPAKKPEKVAA